MDSECIGKNRTYGSGRFTLHGIPFLFVAFCTMGDKVKHILRLLASGPGPGKGYCNTRVFRIRVWLEAGA